MKALVPISAVSFMCFMSTFETAITFGGVVGAVVSAAVLYVVGKKEGVIL